MNKTSKLNMMMTPELKAAAKAKAAAQDRSLAQVIRTLLRRWLAQPPNLQTGYDILTTEYPDVLESLAGDLAQAAQ